MFRPQTGIKRVFISYSKENRSLVDKIAAALQRIGMSPYVAERVGDAGRPLSDKVSEAILGSLHFVTIITGASYENQWVNQELGFAYSLKFLNNLQQNKTILPRFPMLNLAVKNVVIPFNPVEIYPVIEEGIELRGFLDKKSIEYIPFTSTSEKDAIFSLLSQVRYRTVTIYKETLQLNIECQDCGMHFISEIPTQEHVEIAKSKGKVLPYECPHCKRANLVEPHSFASLNTNSHPFM